MMEIKGAILDRVHKSLDEKIWDLDREPPVLRSEVKTEILGKLFEELRRSNFVRYDLWIKDIFLIGSMATLQFKENSDIDITIVILRNELQRLNKHKKDPIGEFKQIMRDLSGNYFNKTLHVINYYFIEAPTKIDSDAIYDIVEERWIKLYPQLREDFDPENFFAPLKEKADEIMQWIDRHFMDLRKSLIDIQNLQELLREFDKIEQQKLLEEIRKKIVSIEDEILSLSSLYTDLIEARNKAFQLDRFDDSGFLAFRFSRNWLPPNIVYKFLERYNYIDLLKKIRSLIKEGYTDIEEAKELLLRERIVS